MIADRFSVVRQLGAGGLGAVYEVEHRFTRHHRAMKVLHARHHGDRDLVERFLKEASAAGRIGNPHIVETFDAGLLPGGAPYVVMEFLEGRPLNEVLRAAGRLDAGLACALLEQVCGAVQAAHEAGIVHRDLKPENLFLTTRDGAGFIKVLDFGVSKFSAEDGADRQTRTGITMGTPLYMAPEQLKDAKSADARSDVYSLGVILFELVTGRVPFEANSFAELAVKVLSEAVPAIDASRADVPEALRAHVARALQKEPAQRFQSAAALREALLPFARNEGVAVLLEARAPTPGHPLQDTFVRAGASEPGPAALHATDPSPERPARATDPSPAGPAQAPGSPSELAAASFSAVERPGAATGRSLPPPGAAAVAAQLRQVASAHRLAPPRQPPARRAVRVAFAALGVLVVAGAALAYRSVRARAAGPSSIAVLPFDNRTGDPENEYLGEGLAESVMYQLTRTSPLRVTPRASVARAKAQGRTPTEAGQALGVDVVLVGELAAHGVVRAELVDVRRDALLWGDRWDLAAKDLLVIQREIAEGARATLLPPVEAEPATGTPLVARRKLTPEGNPEAFRLYLKGRYFWNKRTADGLEQARAHFQQALDREPGFALAWVGLGDSLALLDQYAGVPSRENCPKARAAIDRALELDPSLAAAHASSALLLGHCEFKWAAAEAAFQRAIALDARAVTAHHWYALHLAYRGLFERAREEAKLAHELDPLSLIAANAASVVNGYAGDWAAVLRTSDELIAQDPGFPVAHMWRGRALRATGDLPGARAALQRAFELTGERSFELMGELGATAAAAGDAGEARRWRQRLEEALPRNPSGAMQLAMIAASLGERDEAFRWLEQAFEAQSWFLVQLRVEPLLAPLRDDPRFAALRERAQLW